MTQKLLKPTVKKRVSTTLQIISHPIKCYKTYIKQKSENSIAQKLRAFDDLKALDVETKNRLRDHVAGYMFESARAYFKYDQYQNFDYYLFTCLFFIASIFLLGNLINIMGHKLIIISVFNHSILNIALGTIIVKNIPPIYILFIIVVAL